MLAFLLTRHPTLLRLIAPIPVLFGVCLVGWLFFGDFILMVVYGLMSIPSFFLGAIGVPVTRLCAECGFDGMAVPTTIGWAINILAMSVVYWYIGGWFRLMIERWHRYP